MLSITCALLLILSGGGAALAQSGGWSGGTGDPPPAQPADPPDEPPATPPTAAPAPALIPPALLDAPALPWPGGPPYTPVDVTLLLLIDEQGGVEERSLLQGDEPWASIALEQAAKIRFDPATEGGVPVAVEVPFTWTFEPPPVQIRGVLKLESGEPAPRVTVIVGETTLDTDSEGRFSVRELPPGEVVLRIEDANLEVPPVPVTVTPGQLTELELTARVVGAENVAVGVYRRPSRQVVSRTLTAEELRTTPGTMGDPVRAVQNLPGVVRTPFDSGWVLVRGGDPEDTGLYIDGVRVPLIYHLGGFTSVIHPQMVDRVDFYPGGYGARYGRATAGAVDLVSRPVRAERRVEAGADLLHASAYVQTPIGEKNGVALAIRRSYLDKVLGLVLTPEQAAIAPRFWDWQGRWDAERFGLFWLGYRDAIDAPTGNGDEVATVNIGTNRLHGRGTFDLGSATLQVLPVFARDLRYLDLDETTDERTQTTFALRVELQDPGKSPVGVQAGLDLEAFHYDIKVNGLGASAWLFSPDPYATLRVGVDRQLTVGMRLETFKVTDQLWRVSPSPRIAARVPLTSVWTLVADAGVYHQYPTMEWMIGLPTGPYLRPERSYGQGAGVRMTLRRLSLELDGYWRKLENVTLFEDDGTLGQGSGLAYGVEGLARWTQGPLSGWIAYTYSRSLRAAEPGDLLSAHLYDQPHYLVNVASFSFGRGWSLSSRFRIGSGYAWDRVTEEAYDILTMEPFPLIYDEKQRLRPYHALDVKLAKKAQLRSWGLEFYLDVQNVYNRRIEEPIINGIDDRETVYGKGLPVLPIFGVKGGWAPPLGTDDAG
ncbi:MAG: TonB-dependent receptor [Alphaproteobacteria bacterium]|nr:TonB-dependent receptor [Alphaproteobacteria bacterium]